MLWESMTGGLSVLTFWQTYVAGLLYVGIFFIPAVLFGMFLERGPRVGAYVGCLGMLLIPILQVAGLMIFVLTMSPIIFGVAKDAAWSFPWTLIAFNPLGFIKLVGLLVMATFILAFIPVVGTSPTVQTLVLGGLSLAVVIGLIDGVNPGVLRHINFIPGFWLAGGLVLFGAILSWIGLLIAGLFAVIVDPRESGLGQLIAFPIAAVFGFLPIFMYGAWLGAQLRGHF
jgi:hypothetical protein